MKWIPISLVAILTFLSSATVVACDLPKRDVLGSIVRVISISVEGSGVVIDSNHVITAAHVLDSVSDISVDVKGVLHTAEVVAVYPEWDVALLKTDTADLQPVSLMKSDLQPFEEVWAVGFPFGGHLVVNNGRYEGLLEGELQTTAHVDSGQSGGGLLACESGRYVLAGVITAYGAIDLGDRIERIENFSLSAPVAEIKQMIRYQHKANHAKSAAFL